MALTAKKVYAILKRQISDMEAKLNSPVRYRGTVATADLLPLNPDIGDMYNIESKSVYGEAGMNVAWNGVVWDTMGAPIDMSLYFTKEEAETVIQRLVTEYFEKNPVKPGATTEQAQQIEQNKTDITSLKTDLSTKITKFYASSQGETHLADSDNGKIQDMMLFGKSEQAVTTGAQLLGSDTVFIRNTDDVSISINNPYEVSWTHNTNVPMRGVYLDNVNPILANKQYTISFDARFSDGNSHDMRCVDTDKICVNGKNSILIKIHEKNSTVSFYTRGNITEGLSVTISNIMLEEGSTAHDFEPYTGGIPSPNPDYPQEIKSVVNPTVKVRGKNLLNYNAWKGTPITRGTAIYENNGITLTATKNDCYSEMGNNFPDNAKIKVSEGETLTLSWEQIENNKEGYIYIFGNGIASNSVNIDNRKSKKLSYTVPSGVTFITFRFGVAATGDTISYKNIQIEKGSEATSYEPYHDEQTVTLPYTLNAIPVSSGGNVTIDGQQYIADYVDVERGKLVRHSKEKSDTISIAVAGSVGGLGSYDYDIPFTKNVICNITNIVYEDINQGWASKQACISGSNAGELRVYLPVGNHNVKIIYELETPEEIDLTKEEIVAFKALATYYPTTNISINSEQLDGYTVFNYPISMENGWNYVKQQIGDTRDYIYNMDTKTQDIDTQAAEAYVNSEYAVALTELEV